jgi:multidrug resistance efflux pump
MMDHGRAKLDLNNAQQTMDALDKKHRRRTIKIKALRIELAQLENSIPMLTEKIERAKSDLRAAKTAYRRASRGENALNP